MLCPKNGDGHLVARRARRTGNVFWGCSNYPRCDFTTNHEPTGAIHDAHDDGKGAIARRGESGLCLTLRGDVELPEGNLVGLRLAGGSARSRGAGAAGAWRRWRRPAGGARSGGGAREGREARRVEVGGWDATHRVIDPTMRVVRVRA